MGKESSKEVSFSKKERDQVSKALEILFATNFISKKRLYWENFVRGLTFSIGSIIGATVGIALILWVLSFFNTVPFIGPIVEHAQNTINQND